MEVVASTIIIKPRDKEVMRSTKWICAKYLRLEAVVYPEN